MYGVASYSPYRAEDTRHLEAFVIPLEVPDRSFVEKISVTEKCMDGG